MLELCGKRYVSVAPPTHTHTCQAKIDCFHKLSYNVRLTEALLWRVIRLKHSFAIENASGTYVFR